MILFYFVSIALIAQLVEQLPFKQKVAGSNPAGRTASRLSSVGQSDCLVNSRSSVRTRQAAQKHPFRGVFIYLNIV